MNAVSGRCQFLFGQGAGGKYKLCYQAPGGSDSVEQTPKDSTIVLTVEQVEPGESSKFDGDSTVFPQFSADIC